MPEETWWPSEAEWKNKITKDDWKWLLDDDSIFTDKSKIFLKRLLHIGGEATCAELAKKYGRTASFYIGVEQGLASRIIKKMNLTPISDNGREWKFSVLFLGRHVDKSKDENSGSYIWKIRDELKTALEESGLLTDETYPLYDKKHDWASLLSEYKKFLADDEKRKVAFDDEVYKWETITFSHGKSWNEILSYLMKNPNSNDSSNLLYHNGIGNAKYFIDDDEIGRILEKLCAESENFENRFKAFQSEINGLSARTFPSEKKDKMARLNDERSASVFLTCNNPQQYTFYKDSYYSKLCKYLEIPSEAAGKKYEHYLSLINEFEKFVVADKTIMDFYDSHTGRYIKSTKLIAQNIIYVLFESGAQFTHLQGAETMTDQNIEKYKTLLQHTRNLILHGAPGTGKTYLARQIAEAMGAETDFVQFHPSYDYTDFVEGIRPKCRTSSDSADFELVDGTFKKFCVRALKNYLNSKKSASTLASEINLQDKVETFINDSIDSRKEFELVNGNKFTIEENLENKIIVNIPNNQAQNISITKKTLYEILDKKIELTNVKDIRLIHDAKTRQQQDSYIFVLAKELSKLPDLKSSTIVEEIKQKSFVFIIDEINRGEMSKILGELFFAIDPDYRGAKNCSHLVTQYANMQTEPNIFDSVLDERQIFGHFFVPENVYIIGTMNDIDRSVESMDLAMRRRFAFEEITAEQSRDTMLTKANEKLLPFGDETIEALRTKMTNLNDALVSRDIALPGAYKIGAAYFLKFESYKSADASDDDAFDSLWNYNLEPLLREYLRGQDSSGEKLKILKAAYDKSTPSNAQDKSELND